MLNGGICGALLDCHSNWTAAWHLMNANKLDVPPCTVTAEFHVKLRKPTPTDRPVKLRARVVESSASKAVVEATLEAHGEVTCTCRGVFVAVKEGHRPSTAGSARPGRTRKCFPAAPARTSEPERLDGRALASSIDTELPPSSGGRAPRCPVPR